MLRAFRDTREDGHHATDTQEEAFGGRVEVTKQDGKPFSDELAAARAHPSGANPLRPDDIRKFRVSAEGSSAAMRNVATGEPGIFSAIKKVFDVLQAQSVLKTNINVAFLLTGAAGTRNSGISPHVSESQ